MIVGAWEGFPAFLSSAILDMIWVVKLARGVASGGCSNGCGVLDEREKVTEKDERMREPEGREDRERKSEVVAREMSHPDLGSTISRA